MSEGEGVSALAAVFECVEVSLSGEGVCLSEGEWVSVCFRLGKCQERRETRLKACLPPRKARERRFRTKGALGG